MHFSVPKSILKRLLNRWESVPNLGHINRERLTDIDLNTEIIMNSGGSRGGISDVREHRHDETRNPSAELVQENAFFSKKLC